MATAQARSTTYHTAFENGTIDDATAGPRIKQLRGERTTQGPPRRPRRRGCPPARAADARHPRWHRAYLTRTIAARTSGERKRAIEALVHEVRITEHGMVPVFKIPSGGRPPRRPGADGSTATTTIRASCSRNGAVGGADGTPVVARVGGMWMVPGVVRFVLPLSRSWLLTRGLARVRPFQRCDRGGSRGLPGDWQSDRSR